MGELLIEDISKKYILGNGKSFIALEHVSFTLHENECVSLIGSSGSGKSTLSRMILGIEKPDTGKILLDNVDLTKLNINQWKSHRKKIQGVFQDSTGSLNRKISVYANMQESLKNLSNKSKKEREACIFELMEQLQVDKAILKVPPIALSGGQQRRVSLIRALVLKPKFLVLDEILSGLDYDIKESVLDILMNYKRQYGCAYLFITHDKESCYRISDKILLINHGKIISCGYKQ